MKKIKIILVSTLILTQVASIYTAQENNMTSEIQTVLSKSRKNSSSKTKKPQRSNSTDTSNSTSPDTSNPSAIAGKAHNEVQEDNSEQQHIAGQSGKNSSSKTKKPKGKRSNSTRKSNSTSPHKNKHHKPATE